MSRRRVSRWDRPPGPKDVRWFLRLVGKVLIGTGLLMFGFVAYQLWGTGIQYARAQDRLENQFEAMLAELSTTSPTTSPTASTTTPTSSTSTASTTAITSTTPTAPIPTTTAPGVAPASTTLAPSTPAPSTTTPLPTTTTVPPSSTTTIPSYADVIAGMDISEGDPIGFLGIPRLDLGVYIVPGVGRDDLKQGVGHFPQTPMPGQLGNASVAGHRTTYGHPFLDLDQLEVGDEIDVTMPYGGSMFVYRVTSIEIVDPSDIDVIATTDPTTATLTLTTCHPAYSARQRLIVHAVLDLAASPAPGQAVINYGLDEPFSTESGLPGEEPADPSTDPTTTSAGPTTTPSTDAGAVATVGGQSASPTSTAPASIPGTTESVSPPVTGGETDSVPPPGGGDEIEQATSGGDGEAFSNRWFTDDEAFSQVVLWAGSCAAIVVAAYQLAKRFRNLLIGLAIGVVPFVVGLYFFYENVNRLLPAAL